MSKREVFIVAEDGVKLDSEGDVFAKLDSDEAFLLEQHPEINEVSWRVRISVKPGMQRERIAVITLDRLRALRDALQDTDTPAWEAAALGIKYQEMVTIYRQPVTASAKGKAHRTGARGREPTDDLAMLVLRNLGDMSTKEKLKLLEERDKIAGVHVRSTGPANKRRWFFERKDRQGKIVSSEDYAESTLVSKKFPKSKQRVIEN